MDRPLGAASRAPLRSRSRVAFLAVVIAFLFLSAYLLIRKSVQVSTAHRPRPISPYRNTGADVKYVGDATCARCHAEIAATYQRHPMGRSLTPIADFPLPDAGAAGGRPLFVSGGLGYSIENRDGRVFHQETRRDRKGQIAARNEAEVRFVLGSGQQGLSFLIERSGFLFESPISWYTQNKRWDLSPSYGITNYHFDRPIVPACLICHCNRVDSKSGPLNQYRPPIFLGHAIGCERCHGPGELHVAQPLPAEGRDPAIVNPGRLEPALRDAVCEQCHLIGEKRILAAGRREDDYRPGLPLYPFWTVLTPAANQAGDHFVGQVEQMHESRCYGASRGALGCISCHDPHRIAGTGSTDTALYYRKRCLACHQDRGCALPEEVRKKQSASDDCKGCHMPRISSFDVAHAATTNHRILRQPAIDAQAPVRSPAGGPLVPFHRDMMSTRERHDLERDIGVAKCGDGFEGARQALPLLEAALKEHADDVAAWEAKGTALELMDRGEEALAAFEEALALEPTRETALVAAARRAAKLDRRASAVSYWRRAITVSPWRPEYHAELGHIYFRDGNWAASVTAFQAALRLHPFSIEVRKGLIRSYLNKGEVESARRELTTTLGIDPSAKDELLRWFPASGHSQSFQ
jgi:Tetratricopeptide repeat/Cytochrome c554 and c-prime